MHEITDLIAHAAEKHYDNVAVQYGATDKSPEMSHISMRLRTLCALTKPFNVLDLGCGTGRYFNVVSGTGMFLGVDISEGMLCVAKDRKQELLNNGFDSVVLMHGNMLDMSVNSDTKFELIYSIGLLGYHLPFNRMVAERIAGMLAANGTFFLQAVQANCLTRCRMFIKRCISRQCNDKKGLLSSYSATIHSLNRNGQNAGLFISRWEYDTSLMWNKCPTIIAEFKKGDSRQ